MDDGGIGGGVLIMLLMLVEQTTKRDSIGSANGCCNDDGSLCNLHDDDGVGRQCDLLLQMKQMILDDVVNYEHNTLNKKQHEELLLVN